MKHSLEQELVLCLLCTIDSQEPWDISTVTSVCALLLPVIELEWAGHRGTNAGLYLKLGLHLKLDNVIKTRVAEALTSPHSFIRKRAIMLRNTP